MSDQMDCRTYVDHVRLQHHQIHRLLDRLRSAIYGAEGCEIACEDARLLLGDLRDRLERHFAEEEGGGCVDEAVSLCPRLSKQAQDLDAQHPRLLAAIDRIRAKFEGCSRLGANRRIVELELDEFTRDYAYFEESERSVLREGFGIDEA